MKAKSAGFTLLELMIVVALVAVLIGISAPSMGEFIRNSRITGKANDLLAGLNVARTEAIKRRVPVTVCATDDSLEAEPACDAGADLVSGSLLSTTMEMRMSSAAKKGTAPSSPAATRSC